MNMLDQALMNPGLPYVVLAAGLLACIVLFLSIKLELHRRAAGTARGTGIEETVEGLSAAFAQIRERLDSPAQQTPAVAWSANPSVNLTRRGQVLRLFRRGDSPRQIASSLGMNRGEVDLIIKVHQMVLNRSNNEAREAI